MACAIDLVIVGVLIMAPNTWASPTTSGSAATWPPSGQPPKDRPRRVAVLIIDKMVRMIYG
jgi:hypothetical protein